MIREKRYIRGFIIILASVIISCFKICPVQAGTANIQNGYYMIKSANGNIVLDINNNSTFNGGNLEVYKPNQGTNQIFYIQRRGNGVYSIKVLCSNKYLHRSDDGNRTNVHQWEGYGAGNSKWNIEYSNSKGYYFIKNLASGKYLDNTGGRTTLGNNVQLYFKNSSNAQKWKLVRVNRPQFQVRMSNSNVLSGYYNRRYLIRSSRVAGTITSNYPVTYMTMDVYDMRGRRMYVGRSGNPNMVNFKFQCNIQISKLPKGRYYYRAIAYNAQGEGMGSRKYYFNVY